MSQATAAEPATAQGPLELSREADAEARRIGIPSARRAMQAGTGTA
jgi:predicted Zn-dependent protease